MNDGSRSKRIVATTLMLGFLAIAAGLGYWQFVEGPRLLANPKFSFTRQEYVEANTVRGRILDRDGEVNKRKRMRVVA